jgi:hypothetical protein
MDHMADLRDGSSDGGSPRRACSDLTQRFDKVVSFKSNFPQIRQLDFITRNSKQ